MLAYLSKKISVPNDTQVTSLAWHAGEGWLAVGGDNGLLRVLKLEVQQEDKDSKIKGLAAPSILAMNQTLEAHQAAVVGVTWNEQESKLTTCDKNGLIVVWIMFKNTWTQEMINNRNKSAVSMIQWNKEGQKICIVYEDGAVIVGSVDGNRIWGKELRGSTLTHVQWSPESKVLLFGNKKGEILIYDSHGAYNSKMTLYCLVNCTGPVKLVGLHWYAGIEGYISPNCPCLAVAFDNGHMQVMRHELDDKPVLIDALMTVKTVCWSHNGSLLAVAGTQLRTDEREISNVLFYTPFGQLLHTLRIPGRGLSAISWEGSGLRMAISVGPYIYFANIRHNYKWAYFSNTIVYSYKKMNYTEQCAMFWNTATQERYCKTCYRLLHISSCPDYGMLVTQPTALDSQYALMLCNSLGTPVETKYIPFEPQHVTISHTHIIAATSSILFVWHYRTTSRLAAPEFNTIVSKALESHDMLVHIDDKDVSESNVDFTRVQRETSDTITSLCASDQMIVVGRLSGLIQVYSLPQVAIKFSFTVQCQPKSLSLNCDSTQLSIVDNNGILTLYSMSNNGKKLALERKEVWGVKWSDDNPDLFAIMEKTRMYIFRGLDPEEPVISSASICSFSDLQVKAVLLDELMKDPDNPQQDLVVNLDTKSLRDTRQLLEKVGFEDSFQFINDNPHPRLWRLLAHSALEAFNFDMAEKAFVCCSDYHGIQFVKRLQKLDSVEKQTAELAAFCHRFDDAENLYIQMDRKDLALNMRIKLGDWFRVLQLLKGDEALGNDTQLTQTWNAIGDYYSEWQMWEHALGYYINARNLEQIANIYFIMEEFDKLEELAETLPENHTLLQDLAEKFRSLGMCQAAVKAYLKCHSPKSALQCCIELNQWDIAIKLSQQYDFKNVEEMLIKKATELIQNYQILQAIELYRKANHFIDAAKLLTEVAKLAHDRQLMPSKMKKICVLAGLLVEDYHEYIRSTTKNSDITSSTLQGLLLEDQTVSGDSSLLDTAWRGAEGYHLLMLAQRQLYNGEHEASMKTALVLQSYNDILSPLQIYSLLALASNACHAYSICSQAFMHLESMPSLSDTEREQYEELAAEIFRRHPPRDKTTPLSCPSCETPLSEWCGQCPSCNTNLMICMWSGEIIQSYNSWLCPRCKHRTRDDVVTSLLACPLCHMNIT